jgi:predicted RNase H-like HicB family nuclease
MSNESYRITIEALQNGYVVEVPDMDLRAEKEKEAKKNHKGPGAPYVGYMGDCTEKYACTTVDEVVTKIKGALSKLPESEFSEGFKAAVKEK